MTSSSTTSQSTSYLNATLFLLRELRLFLLALFLRWIPKFTKSPRRTASELKLLLRDAEFKKRARANWQITRALWARTEYLVPILVSSSVALWHSLTYGSLASSLGIGVFCYLIMSRAMHWLPGVAVLALPLGALLAFRAFMPVELPTPPADTASPSTQLTASPTSQQTGPVQPASPAQLRPEVQPTGALSRQVEEGERKPLLERLSHSTGAVRLTDQEDLDVVLAWVEQTRTLRNELETIRAMSREAAKLTAVLPPSALIALRFGGEAGFINAANFNAGDVIRVTFSGITHSFHTSTADGEPEVPQGFTKVLHPDGGYMFVRDFALPQWTFLPLDESPKVRGLVLDAARAGDKDLLQNYRVLTTTRPTVALATHVDFSVLGEDAHDLLDVIDVDRVEEAALAGSVLNTDAIELSRLHQQYRGALAEEQDLLACRAAVAAGVRALLQPELRALEEQAESAREERIRARQTSSTNPYDYLGED